MFCRFENVLMAVENISCFVEEVPQNSDPSEEYFLGAMTLLSDIAYKLCPANSEPLCGTRPCSRSRPIHVLHADQSGKHPFPRSDLSDPINSYALGQVAPRADGRAVQNNSDFPSVSAFGSVAACRCLQAAIADMYTGSSIIRRRPAVPSSCILLAGTDCETDL